MSRRTYLSKPFINVTPLIDVLLVVLIIFMVASPSRPSRFNASLPDEPDNSQNLPPDPLTLLVTIGADRTLRLNGLTDMGTVDDPFKLSTRLVALFQERKENQAYKPEMLLRTELPEDQRLQKTVFIKAPAMLNYGDVVKVIDAVKGAGGQPVGLQLDNLN